jgi:hypothetical protein
VRPSPVASSPERDCTRFLVLVRDKGVGQHVEALAFEFAWCVFLLPRVGFVEEQAGGVVGVLLAEFLDDAAAREVSGKRR